MPANLPPHYHALEEKLRAATSDRDKTSILEEMYALLPKHKGTDKLQADLKKRLSKLRKAAKGGPSAARARFSYHVDKEGAGQVFLVGGPNAGKSSLLAALTRAEPEVADYPFTTRKPAPGMMFFEDVALQLVDLPPLSTEFMEPWVPQIVRYGDAIALVVDLGDDAALDGLDEVLTILEAAKIAPVSSLEALDEGDRSPSFAYLPTVVVGAKADLPDAADRLTVLQELYGARWSFHSVSADDAASLDRLRRALYDLLRLLRVYGKMPGKPPDRSRPYVLRRGDTLADFALQVHKDFARNLSYARVWGEGKFDGQRVTRDYVLCDEDVIELRL